MYSKGGSTSDARKVFDEMPLRNALSWNVMISGYARNDCEEKALHLFLQMQEAGVSPNQYVISSMMKVCVSLGLLDLGKQLHGLVVKSGLQSHVIVGSASFDFYVKYCCMEEAHSVLGEIPRWDVVSWTAMIGEYVQMGRDFEALQLFCQMLEHSLTKPNQFTYSGLLRACSSLADFEPGRQIHAHLIKALFESDVSVGNSLVSMYARCGAIEDSRKVFDLMPTRNVVSWNSMITGYALHGNGEKGVELFEQMQDAGVRANHITFVGVLSVCSHGGLVEQSLRYFHLMSLDHGIGVTMEHYACMVDLLGWAGRLDEALQIIRQIPQEPKALIRRTLLGACKIHGNLEIGQVAAWALLELEPKHAATYVLLSNIYAACGRWDDVAKLKKMMKDNGVKNEPGNSWIQVKNRVHEFVVEDRSYLQTEEIYPMMKIKLEKADEVGHVEDESFVM